MVFPSPATVNSPVPVAFVTVGGKVNSPVRFAENCEVDPCACVVFPTPAPTVVVLVPVVCFWAPAVVVLVPVVLFWAPAVVVFVPVVLFWATTIATGVNPTDACYEKYTDNSGYC